MLPILQIGPLAVQTPGLVLLAGVWGATLLIERRAVQLGQDPEKLNRLIFAALVAGVIGARLGHIALHPAAYGADLGAIVALTPAALSAEAGLGTMLITVIILGQRERLALRPTLSAAAPGLALFMAAVSLADFCSGAAYGAPTRVSWAIQLWGAARHPTQLYELALAAALTLLLWFGPFRAEQRGLNFLLGMALFAASRLFTEGWHGDSALWAGWRVAQGIAWGALMLALSLLRRWAQAHPQ